MKDKSTKSITIFMDTGHTFTFHEVTINFDNENVLDFSYSAMSDGRQKRVRFPKFRIVGHSEFDS